MSETSDESSAQTKVTIFETSTMYWKMCTVFLGIAFLIAIASHSGPARAGAGEYSQGTNLLSLHQKQAAAIQQADAQQALSIGGFDSLDGTPAFVIVNQTGQRVGILPMNAVNND